MNLRACLATLVLALGAGSAFADPVNILFVGNSFTHGRYEPALGYNAGPGDAPGSALVHDLLCPSLPCTGAEGAAPVTPTRAGTPGGTLAGQLAYLQANPKAQYTEVGPFGGVAGIFLQLTREAGLDYDVSLIAVSSATLKGYANDAGNEANDLPLIENPKFSQVVLQDQTFDPLPPTISVNWQTVPTRGNPGGFQTGVAELVNGIDAADARADVPYAAITLAQTAPLASYGYTSDNPKAPIFGSSTVAQQNGSPAYAPYVGDPDPIAAMASDLHDAYETAAADFTSTHPQQSPVSVSLDGDAWVSAIDLHFAQQNPFLSREPPGEVDLWDSRPLLACCTVPIGYHPSVFGDYLNALVLFGHITGENPERVLAEYDPLDRGYRASASRSLGIPPLVAAELALAAEATLVAGHPVPGRPLPCPATYWTECRAAGLHGGLPGR